MQTRGGLVVLTSEANTQGDKQIREFQGAEIAQRILDTIVE